jgi:hypothetical protein
VRHLRPHTAQFHRPRPQAQRILATIVRGRNHALPNFDSLPRQTTRRGHKTDTSETTRATSSDSCLPAPTTQFMVTTGSTLNRAHADAGNSLPIRDCGTGMERLWSQAGATGGNRWQMVRRGSTVQSVRGLRDSSCLAGVSVVSAGVRSVWGAQTRSRLQNAASGVWALRTLARPATSDRFGIAAYR